MPFLYHRLFVVHFMVSLILFYFKPRRQEKAKERTMRNRRYTIDRVLQDGSVSANISRQAQG
jgi:hypothetical protein